MTTHWLPAEWPAPANIVAGMTLRGGDIEQLALPGKPCWLTQVHGARVVPVGRYDTPPEADALVGHKPGDVCAVRTADCLPLLLCATDGTEIAAAHAGWRGLAAGVIEATVASMTHQPGDLLAWMGPAISQPAFEVGGEVREAFLARDPEAAACFYRNDRARWQADLYGLARRRLRAVGVTAVYGGCFCTYADTERFFSYRRDGDSRRMVSVVALSALENTDGAAI
ncbi:MAG: peptidoglycan editing factor PgeF [Woeseiaceae bacterium]|nr:peptidoglycan editing factor PgeF [Woeseiaceae bacterium]